MCTDNWVRFLRTVFVVFCFGLILPASASAELPNKVDFKVKGDMDITLGAVHRAPLGSDFKNDNDFTRQRLRLWITASTSESLSATLFLRIAPAAWGQKYYRDGSHAGHDLGADGVNLRVRGAWLDFKRPDSNFSARMGIIPISVPHESFFSGILFSTGAGVELNYRFCDEFLASVFWSRLYNEFLNDHEAVEHYSEYDGKHALSDEADLFGIKLPITLIDQKTNITPWGMYGLFGKDSGYWRNQVPAIGKRNIPGIKNDGRAWWAGLAARTAYFDPFVFKFDFAYGSLSTGKDELDFNTRGWQASAALDYKLDSCTPGIFGWYGSGSKKDDVRNDRQWGYTPIIDTFGESFNPTSFGFGRNLGVQDGNAVGGYIGGTWGIGAQVADIGFIDKLSHEIRFAYYTGTNDKELAADAKKHRPGNVGPTILTKGDDAYEVNFNHQYKAYDNLTISADLGYIHLSRSNEWKSDLRSENAWQAALNFKYHF